MSRDELLEKIRRYRRVLIFKVYRDYTVEQAEEIGLEILDSDYGLVIYWEDDGSVRVGLWYRRGEEYEYNDDLGGDIGDKYLHPEILFRLGLRRWIPLREVDLYG